MELLECKKIYKSYGEKQVLKNVNLKIPRGKIIGLLGKNGTGKSTLIKLINDLLTPTSGEILINGEKVGIELVVREFGFQSVQILQAGIVGSSLPTLA